jgi:hypothetical protein
VLEPNRFTFKKNNNFERRQKVMKMYSNPKLEIVKLACADVLTFSSELIERPNIADPNEIPGVPLG